MNNFFVLLGSNIEPSINLAKGKKELNNSSNIAIIKESSIKKTIAHGFDGDDFLNQVMLCSTNMNFSNTLKQLKEIEIRCGRKRDPNNKFTSRTLDLDIIDWANVSGEIDGYLMPDPDINKHDFIKELYLEVKTDI